MARARLWLILPSPSKALTRFAWVFSFCNNANYLPPLSSPRSAACGLAAVAAAAPAPGCRGVEDEKNLAPVLADDAESSALIVIACRKVVSDKKVIVEPESTNLVPLVPVIIGFMTLASAALASAPVLAAFAAFSAATLAAASSFAASQSASSIVSPLAALAITQVWPFHPENQKFQHYF